LIAVSSGRGAKDGRCSKGHDAAWRKDIPPAHGGLSQVDSVARVSGQLAEAVESLIVENSFTVVLGGDHSSAIGT